MIYTPAHSVIAFGKKGSGKTDLMKRAYIIAQPNIIILDTKQNEDWFVRGKLGKPVAHSKVHSVGSGRWVWAPPDSWLTDPEAQEYDIRKLYLKPGARPFYIDEFGDLCPAPNSCPKALRTWAFRGRSAQKGLCGTTQRPHGVPLFLLSEADHIFVLHLALPEDQVRVQKVMQQKIDWSTLPEGGHDFYYKGPGVPVAGPYRLREEDLVK